MGVGWQNNASWGVGRKTRGWRRLASTTLHTVTVYSVSILIAMSCYFNYNAIPKQISRIHQRIPSVFNLGDSPGYSDSLSLVQALDRLRQEDCFCEIKPESRCHTLLLTLFTFLFPTVSCQLCFSAYADPVTP